MQLAIFCEYICVHGYDQSITPILLKIDIRVRYMCVGATKGTFRRDIKMIVNHDYIKQCIIFTKNNFG